MGLILNVVATLMHGYLTWRIGSLDCCRAARHRRNGDHADRITPLLTGRPRGATVLLSHSPLQGEQAAASGAGLMLSGHTHGGQIWPFGYLVAHYYPYLAGRYQIGEMTLIISRGTGLWGPRMRLWSPGEIIEIVLRVGGD